jgi:hypothetical protein
MTYLLLDDSNERYSVVHADAMFSAASVWPLNSGRAGPPYRIVDNNNDETIAIINSLDEAIPTFAAYYASQPPRWRCEGANRHGKSTQFAELRVEQVGPGQWSASRDDQPLMRDGKLAIFGTLEEAQRTTDAHERQGYPNCEPIDDGLSWEVVCPWWLDPHAPANIERAVVRRG